MKYILYRSFGDLDKDIKKHELVAVEIGGSIDEVTNALIKDVAEDLAEMPEYAHCEIAAYAPELIHNFRRVKRYQYAGNGFSSSCKGEHSDRLRDCGNRGVRNNPQLLLAILKVLYLPKRHIGFGIKGCRVSRHPC